MRVPGLPALLLTTALCLTGAVGAGPAAAHDAPMPADARHGLLVDEPWAMAHWAPFDERRLERELGIREGQLEAFLYDDHHTVAQLARARHVPFGRLVRRLTSWTREAPERTARRWSGAPASCW